MSNFDISDYPDFTHLYNFVEQYNPKNEQIFEEDDVLKMSISLGMEGQEDLVYSNNIDDCMKTAIINYLQTNDFQERFLDGLLNQFQDNKQNGYFEEYTPSSKDIIGGSLATLTNNEFQDMKNVFLDGFKDFFGEQHDLENIVFNNNTLDEPIYKSYYNYLDSHIYINGVEVDSVEDIRTEICNAILDEHQNILDMFSEHILNYAVNDNSNHNLKTIIQNVEKQIENNDFDNLKVHNSPRP